MAGKAESEHSGLTLASKSTYKERYAAGKVLRDKCPRKAQIHQALADAFASYRATLPTAYHSMLDRYKLCDAAIKVVGIGSVGTSCCVLLLMAGEDDPLFLQVKEARSSVLEPYAGKRDR